MSNNKTKSKNPTKKIYTSTILSEIVDKNAEIFKEFYSFLPEVGKLTKGRLPFFIYYTNLLSGEDTDFYKMLFKEYEVEVYGLPADRKKKAFIETILSSIGTKDGVTLSCTISNPKSEVAYFIEELLNIKMMVKRIQDENKNTFPLFQSVKRKDDVLEITISYELSLFYMFDYAINHKRYKDIFTLVHTIEKEAGFKNSEIESLLRVALSRRDAKMEAIDVFSSVEKYKRFTKKDIAPVSLSMMQKALEGNKELFVKLKEVGVAFAKGYICFSEQRYTPTRQPFLYMWDMSNEDYVSKKRDEYGISAFSDKKIYRNTPNTFKDGQEFVVFDDLHLDSTLYFSATEEGLRDEEILEMFERFKYEKDKESAKVKAVRSSLKRVWLNFIRKNRADTINSGKATNITYTKEMEQKIIEEGLDLKELSIEFNLFKDYYISRGEKRVDWVAAWAKWLKRYKTNDFKKKKYKGNIETKKENSGQARNIVFTDEMKEFAVNEGMLNEDIELNFAHFKDYYLSKNETRDDWVATWRIWVRNTMKRNDNAYKMRTELENRFYTSKLVSESIIADLKKYNISPADIIRGEVTLDEIRVISIPVPPSMGKGTESIFMYADKQAQQNALNKILKTTGNNDTKNNKDREIDYIDTVAIEEVI